MRLTLEQRFWSHVNKTETCWVWTGHKMKSGYASVYAGGGSKNPITKLVHRLAYELTKGLIPTGLTIDHLCSNRLCVRPDHLEAVTMRTNVLRSSSHIAKQASSDHCVNGHMFDAANTYRWRGGRYCRKCRNANAKKHYMERIA